VNQRIRELNLQAMSIVMNGSDPDGDVEQMYIPSEFTKKFAELIVGECLAHGKLTQSQTVVNGSEEYNAGREMGIEVFMNQIKQHFGVEG
jgi:hypothetical protein